MQETYFFASSSAFGDLTIFYFSCSNRACSDIINLICISLSNQSILKEMNPEYSLEGLRLKLKLQYFGHLIDVKNWLIGKDPDAGKDCRWEEKGVAEIRWLDGITDSMDMNLSNSGR